MTAMDAEDIAVVKLAKDQFLSVDPDEINEVNQHAKQVKFEPKIVWRNVLFFVILHISTAFGFYQFLFSAQWKTVFCCIAYWVISVFGITAGAHRLWSHRSFKATWPTRAFMMLCNCVAFQNDIIEWSRDHRCHHKWTDTDADPHNTNRGFFFSHMGWLMTRKHPELKRKGAQLDLSDLTSDPILMFQRRHYKELVILLCFAVPTFIPVFFWNESLIIAFNCVLFRYCVTLHDTWLINSAAHKYGFKPYNPLISPVESFVLTIAAMGEGGHNYHHTFPQDYRTSEYSWHHNVTKMFIDIFAYLGLAYDLNVVPQEVIERQKAKFAKHE